MRAHRSPAPRLGREPPRSHRLLKDLKVAVEVLQARQPTRRLQSKRLRELAQALFSVLDADDSGAIEQESVTGLLGAPLDESMRARLDGGLRVTREEFFGLVEARVETAGLPALLRGVLLLEKRVLAEERSGRREDRGPQHRKSPAGPRREKPPSAPSAEAPQEHFAIDPLYGDLHTSSGCVIRRTEERGITLEQLRLLQAHVQRRCDAEGWTDRSTASPTHGKQLTPPTIDLYQVCDWVVQPATKERQCSYVELVAGCLQVPRWFVSHWWGEPVFDFIACLEQHALDRELGVEAPYWVCAYANNQWKLGEELVEDLGQTSFRKAMNLAEGTVSVLDKDAVCYTRVWCCYEVHTSVVALVGSDGSTPYQYDMYTTREGGAVGITDGFTKADLRSRMPSDSKYERERPFPPHLMERALRIELQRASASAEGDKRRILNCIVGAEDSSSDPPAEHPLYEDLNGTLRGRFAAAGLRSALESSELGGAYLAALAKSKLQKLTLSFFQSEAMTDDCMATLASSFPPTLQHLDLDFSFCASLTDAGVAALAECIPRSVCRLALSFCSCHGLTDASVESLAEVVGSRPLEDLVLVFYGNKCVSDACMQGLVEAIPGRLSRLILNVAFCWSVADLSVVALAGHLSAQLRHLEVWLSTLGITDAAMRALAAALPANLDHLVLGTNLCESLGDPSAEAIAAGLPRHLRHLQLNVKSWPGLTDRGVQAIAAALPETLQVFELWLNVNPQLTDQSVQALALALGPSLQELMMHFSYNTLLTQEGSWLPLARALPPGLAQFELSIDGCTESSAAREAMLEALKGRCMACSITA